MDSNNKNNNIYSNTSNVKTHIIWILLKKYNISYFGILTTIDSVPRQCFMNKIFLLGNVSNNFMISYNIVDTSCRIKGIGRI